MLKTTEFKHRCYA